MGALSSVGTFQGRLHRPRQAASLAYVLEGAERNPLLLLALHWRTAVRVGGTILIVTILLGLLAAVALFAWAGLAEPGEPMPSEGYVALALGALAAVLVGIGLMGLVFYSNRRGYDEPPHFHEDH
jgi:Na+(H+)/acetate symporter ActP